MYLYDAKVEIASPNGTRIVPVTDVILRPGKTILEANEAFIRFLFPVPAFKSALCKAGLPQEGDHFQNRCRAGPGYGRRLCA